MNSVTIALWTYGLSIGFALAIAALIHVAGILVKRLNLDRAEAPVDLTMPTASAAKEQETLAVALAIAASRARRSRA